MGVGLLKSTPEYLVCAACMRDYGAARTKGGNLARTARLREAIRRVHPDAEAEARRHAAQGYAEAGAEHYVRLSDGGIAWGPDLEDKP
jgi:hypothetical protein